MSFHTGDRYVGECNYDAMQGQGTHWWKDGMLGSSGTIKAMDKEHSRDRWLAVYWIIHYWRYAAMEHTHHCGSKCEGEFQFRLSDW